MIATITNACNFDGEHVINDKTVVIDGDLPPVYVPVRGLGIIRLAVISIPGSFYIPSETRYFNATDIEILKYMVNKNNGNYTVLNEIKNANKTFSDQLDQKFPD